MLLREFDYHLPAELIAAEPALPRPSARMLDMRGAGFIDRIVADLPHCLKAGDVLVVNNTRVLPARLIGRRGEAKIDVTLHRRIDGAIWHGFAKPAKKLKLGDKVVFSGRLHAEINFIGADGERGFNFNRSGDDLDSAVEEIGMMPLPPYIPRPDGIRADDRENYQTMFAVHNGAVAAPTAGLHFTAALLAELTKGGITLAEVTLHVGAGTFLPVKTEDVRDHKMHLEWGQITAESAAIINGAKSRGGRVVAVGTTSLRVLESCYREHGEIRGYEAETDLFILPGFNFGIVDMLMTNFHLPKSTLLMLISAFTGKSHVEAAYAHAIAQGYRFFSYGDSCLMECRSSGEGR
jgi:S-adenosylmethionine:tRNA ribosyltransferase-isomerase